MHACQYAYVRSFVFAYVRVFVCACVCVRVCVSACVREYMSVCESASVRESVRAFMCVCVCSFVRIHIHTQTQGCTLATKAETTQWSPGLFVRLVRHFFQNLRRHHSIKTQFPVLLVDSHLASLLFTRTLTTEECLVAARISSILTSLRVGNLYSPSFPLHMLNSHSGQRQHGGIVCNAVFCVPTCVRACVCSCGCECECVCAFMCVYVCACVCECVSAFVRVCVFVCVCAYV